MIRYKTSNIEYYDIQYAAECFDTLRIIEGHVHVSIDDEVIFNE